MLLSRKPQEVYTARTSLSIRFRRLLRPRYLVPISLGSCVLIVLCQSRLATSIQHENFIHLHEQGIASTLSDISFQLDGTVHSCAMYATQDILRSNSSSKHRLRMGEELASHGAKAKVKRALRQAANSQPTLRQLLQERDTAARVVFQKHNVTVLLLFTDAQQLCMQLSALLKQRHAPSEVWVAAVRSRDGGKHVQALVDSLEHGGRVRVFSVSVHERGGDHASGTSMLDTRLCFQLALQAKTHYVLVLEPWLVPGLELLSTYVQLAAVPEAGGVLGVAGWRLLSQSHKVLNMSERVLDESHSDLFAASEEVQQPSRPATLNLPDVKYDILVPRLMQVDVLRGSWFVRREWLQLLFRESAFLGQAGDHGLEAAISVLFQRHGDLPSYVVPTIGTDGKPLFSVSRIPIVTADIENAWMKCLWESAIRGDAPPVWRATPFIMAPTGYQQVLNPISRHVNLTSSSRMINKVDAEQPRKISRPVCLLLIVRWEDLTLLQPLYTDLAAAESKYEPRLVLINDRISCSDAATALGLTTAICNQSLLAYQIFGCDETDICSINFSKSKGSFMKGAHRGPLEDCAEADNWLDEAAACADLNVEFDRLIEASGAVSLVAIDHGKSNASVLEAIRTITVDRVGFVLLLPRPGDVPALAFVATIPPSALQQWHSFRIEIAIITANRPTSLHRLLTSLDQGVYFGDSVDVSVSIDAGTSLQTLAKVKSWRWLHGTKHVHTRIVKGGLISAVVESWFPSGDHSYGLLLEDDIEVSPYFYIYLKLMLLTYVYQAEGSSTSDHGLGYDEDLGTEAASPMLIGISLYTPRLIEVKYPRKRIDLYSIAHMLSHQAPVFLQQLPCSWGSLFFPQPWIEFHHYMQQRLNQGSTPVEIPGSAINGWSESWKKFLMELMHLRGYVMLYPNFFNQTSFSTNHLEVGEHIGSKGSKLKHRPIDFTVPLLHDLSLLRELWSSKQKLRALPPLDELAVLDHFSEPSSLGNLQAQASTAVSHHAKFAALSRSLNGQAAQSRAQMKDTNVLSTTRATKFWFGSWLI